MTIGSSFPTPQRVRNLAWPDAGCLTISSTVRSSGCGRRGCLPTSKSGIAPNVSPTAASALAESIRAAEDPGLARGSARPPSHDLAPPRDRPVVGEADRLAGYLSAADRPARRRVRRDRGQPSPEIDRRRRGAVSSSELPGGNGCRRPAMAGLVASADSARPLAGQRLDPRPAPNAASFQSSARPRRDRTRLPTPDRTR